VTVQVIFLNFASLIFVFILLSKIK
jgi:hypothetical protein